MSARPNPMHNLTTLIKRLEAATSRLEDIAQLAIDLNPSDDENLAKAALTPSGSNSTLAPSVTPTPKAVAPQPPRKTETPEEVVEYDNFISTTVESWVKLSNDLGGVIAEQANLVLKGFKESRNLLLLSYKCRKPEQNSKEFQELVSPVVQIINAADGNKEKNRKTPEYDHLTAVADSIYVLIWVTITPKPHKHVDEMLQSAEYYGNKVLKAYKEKDPKQAEWVRGYYKIFRELGEYIKTYFVDDVPWNPQGVSVTEVLKSQAPAPAAGPVPPAGGAPPPPPPPGPPPVLKINEAKADPNPAGGIGAVFSELNKGEAVTKGLRKVDKSEMTHKNPSLRASSTVPGGESSSAVRGKSPAPPPGTKPKPESMRVKKPPKKELEGNKWTIENYDAPSEPVTIDVEMSHSILISKCTNTTIIIKGKGNNVTVENTSRLALVVDDLVSTVDVVKSKNFALQVMGVIPTVMLDQLDGAQIYLSKDSIATRVYSSKSDGINVNIIPEGEEDYKEVPLPSQICSQWDEAKRDMVSEIVTHAG